MIEGTVAYVATSNSKTSMTAFDLFYGRALWKKSYGDVEVTPCLSRERLFFGNTEGTFYCIEKSTGDSRWKFELPDNRTLKGIRSSPAADSATIVFGADDGTVYALDGETGAVKWTFATGAPVLASPLIASGRVFVGNRHGEFFALDIPRAAPRGSRAPPHRSTRTPSPPGTSSSSATCSEARSGSTGTTERSSGTPTSRDR